MTSVSSTDELRGAVAELEANIGRVVLGKGEVIRMCLVALLAGEHVLLEDVPGVGKTLVAKALAKSVAGVFCRIQFTPDLLPSDIVGSSVFNAKTAEFRYSKGPIFANVVLADEINRAPPRTQSALLEAMSDKQVSVDGVTHDLPDPFMVIATQNPFEFEGTYPLPENQLDRFMLCIEIGYPERGIERDVLNTHRDGEPVDHLRPVLTAAQLESLQQKVHAARVDDAINDYILDIVHATRQHAELSLGVSTRGAITLYRATQSLALAEGREYVVPDDVKRLAAPALAHRVVCRGMIREGQRERAKAVIQQILDTARVPE
jgi:MoxR-like ATPase